MTFVARYIDTLQGHGSLKRTDIANFKDVSSVTARRWKARRIFLIRMTLLLARQTLIEKIRNVIDVNNATFHLSISTVLGRGGKYWAIIQSRKSRCVQFSISIIGST